MPSLLTGYVDPLTGEAITAPAPQPVRQPDGSMYYPPADTSNYIPGSTYIPPGAAESPQTAPSPASGAAPTEVTSPSTDGYGQYGPASNEPHPYSNSDTVYTTYPSTGQDASLRSVSTGQEMVLPGTGVQNGPAVPPAASPTTGAPTTNDFQRTAYRTALGGGPYHSFRPGGQTTVPQQSIHEYPLPYNDSTVSFGDRSSGAPIGTWSQRAISGTMERPWAKGTDYRQTMIGQEPNSARFGGRRFAPRSLPTPPPPPADLVISPPPTPMAGSAQLLADARGRQQTDEAVSLYRKQQEAGKDIPDSMTPGMGGATDILTRLPSENRDWVGSLIPPNVQDVLNRPPSENRDAVWKMLPPQLRDILTRPPSENRDAAWGLVPQPVQDVLTRPPSENRDAVVATIDAVERKFPDLSHVPGAGWPSLRSLVRDVAALKDRPPSENQESVREFFSGAEETPRVATKDTISWGDVGNFLGSAAETPTNLRKSPDEMLPPFWGQGQGTPTSIYKNPVDAGGGRYGAMEDTISAMQKYTPPAYGEYDAALSRGAESLRDRGQGYAPRMKIEVVKEGVPAKRTAESGVRGIQFPFTGDLPGGPGGIAQKQMKELDFIDEGGLWTDETVQSNIEAGYFDESGNWTQKAVDDELITADKVGKTATWRDMTTKGMYAAVKGAAGVAGKNTVLRASDAPSIANPGYGGLLGVPFGSKGTNFDPESSPTADESGSTASGAQPTTTVPYEEPTSSPSSTVTGGGDTATSPRNYSRQPYSGGRGGGGQYGGGRGSYSGGGGSRGRGSFPSDGFDPSGMSFDWEDFLRDFDNDGDVDMKDEMRAKKMASRASKRRRGSKRGKFGAKPGAGTSLPLTSLASPEQIRAYILDTFNASSLYPAQGPERNASLAKKGKKS